MGPFFLDAVSVPSTLVLILVILCDGSTCLQYSVMRFFKINSDIIFHGLHCYPSTPEPLSSPDALLKFLADPSTDTPKLQKPTTKPQARCLQSPTIPYAFAQIIISIPLSCGVAFISILPFLQEMHGDLPLKMTVVIVTCLSTLANLILTCRMASNTRFIHSFIGFTMVGTIRISS